MQTVETFPGYTRGLSFSGQFAFVGLSKIRETSVFGGVPIAEHRHELRCGVGVVDLMSGKTVAVFQFLSGVTEIFAVEVVPGVSCPYVAGASVDGKEHDVWIVPRPGSEPPIAQRLPWFAQALNASSDDVATTANVGSVVSLPSKSNAEANRPMSTAEQRVASNPNDAAAWIELGNLRQEQNRQPEALTCYERAVAADPQMSAARQNLGYLLFNQGFPEKARDVYRDLLTRDDSPMNQLLAASVLPTIYRSHDDLQWWRTEQTSTLRRMVESAATVNAANQLVPTTFFWPYQGHNDREIMKLAVRLFAETPQDLRREIEPERKTLVFASDFCRRTFETIRSGGSTSAV